MTALLGAPLIIPTLSLWEPWASLIAAGFKRHETRHWLTRRRGPVAIHAAKICIWDLEPELVDLCDLALGDGWRKNRPLGCIVAVANLTDCLRCEDVYQDIERCDYYAGNYAEGRFAFRFDNVRPLREPLPLIGRQSFFPWRPPADLEARLDAPVSHEACARRATFEGVYP